MTAGEPETVGDLLMSRTLLEAVYDDTPEALNEAIQYHQDDNSPSSRLLDIVATRYAAHEFYGEQLGFLRWLQTPEASAELPSNPLKIDQYEEWGGRLLRAHLLTPDSSENALGRRRLRIQELLRVDPKELQAHLQDFSKNQTPVRKDAAARARDVFVAQRYMLGMMHQLCNKVATFGIGTEKSFPNIAQYPMRVMVSLRFAAKDFAPNSSEL